MSQQMEARLQPCATGASETLCFLVFSFFCVVFITSENMQLQAIALCCSPSLEKLSPVCEGLPNTKDGVWR
jgi:hypothetical protein